jgi:hypothetical protein
MENIGMTKGREGKGQKKLSVQSTQSSPTAPVADYSANQAFIIRYPNSLIYNLIPFTNTCYPQSSTFTNTFSLSLFYLF